jgi:hypothetical protein
MLPELQILLGAMLPELQFLLLVLVPGYLDSPVRAVGVRLVGYGRHRQRQANRFTLN